jgi:hypothetical protein
MGFGFTTAQAERVVAGRLDIGVNTYIASVSENVSMWLTAQESRSHRTAVSLKHSVCLPLNWP